MGMKFNTNISSKRNKQRKAHFTAKGLELTKQFTMSLSPQLKQTFRIKRIATRPGDKVLITTGKYKGKEGKIVMVNRHKRKVCVEDCTITKKDGGIRYIPIHPSNCKIVDLNMDKDRLKMVERIVGSRIVT